MKRSKYLLTALILWAKHMPPRIEHFSLDFFAIFQQTGSILTLFITCANMCRDTLVCGDCSSVALDIWILVTIIGYWLLYFVRGQKVGSE